MAAMRSALMGLCRRRSASWAAASMGGGRGFGPAPAAARTPALPSLRPATVRKLEGVRRFSTEGMKGADQDNKPLLMKLKAEGILRIWRQWSRGSVKNSYEDYFPFVHFTIGFAAAHCLFSLAYPEHYPVGFTWPNESENSHQELPATPLVLSLYALPVFAVLHKLHSLHRSGLVTVTASFVATQCILSWTIPSYTGSIMRMYRLYLDKPVHDGQVTTSMKTKDF